MTQFETIESRVLFSSTVAGGHVGQTSVALEVNGHLNIVGTLQADLITLTQKGHDLVVRVNNYVKTFSASAVTAINIQANAGNDRIVSNATAGTTVMGGAGNDAITTGAGNDTDDGGDGNDTISSGAGSDKDTGDAGNDSIDSGQGDDSLYGGDGDDVLKVGVTIHGSYLFGGSGNDTMIGLDIKHDHANGGGGLDTARGVLKDLLAGVESWK